MDTDPTDPYKTIVKDKLLMDAGFVDLSQAFAIRKAST
ncbi:hypothetical protein Golax_015977 [Gossypium laxum]|uniref:Uncharacterized protein n=1 Tax=Gossypium laxum TaxID=34288 RepID=A0A7J8YVS5_9ROSI|nr:hypothetical protein [Gossypium laxum]